jgi:hypothetical protein
MARWRLPLCTLALLAGAGTAIVETTPAAADPPGLVVARTTSAATSTDKTVTQLCPGNTVVTGGGGYLTAPAGPHQGLVSLDRLEPAGNGSGFTATMREVHPDAGAWQLTVDALCAPQPPGYSVRQQAGALGASSVTVSCPAGNVIGAGGKVVNGNGDVVLDQVVPSADHKSVTARADVVPGSGALNWSVTAYAVCATVAVLPLATFTSGPASPAFTSLSFFCPAGSALYGIGGAVTPGSGATFLDLVHVVDVHHFSARASEDAVSANAANWALTGYGICAS